MFANCSTLFFREKAEKALWFAETYGLTPRSLQFDDATGDTTSLELTKGKLAFPFAGLANLVKKV